jgi:hypothetical protein
MRCSVTKMKFWILELSGSKLRIAFVNCVGSLTNNVPQVGRLLQTITLYRGIRDRKRKIHKGCQVSGNTGPNLFVPNFLSLHLSFVTNSNFFSKCKSQTSALCRPERMDSWASPTINNDDRRFCYSSKSIMQARGVCPSQPFLDQELPTHGHK